MRRPESPYFLLTLAWLFSLVACSFYAPGYAAVMPLVMPLVMPWLCPGYAPENMTQVVPGARIGSDQPLSPPIERGRSPAGTPPHTSAAPHCRTEVLSPLLHPCRDEQVRLVSRAHQVLGPGASPLFTKDAR